MPFREHRFKFDSREYHYKSLDYHRNKNPKKSQWAIKYPEEFRAFELSICESWGNHQVCWGLKVENQKIEPMGLSIKGETLFISKFWLKQSNSPWHGFPASYTDYKDRPTDHVFGMWLNNPNIPPEPIGKMIKGKR